MASISNAQRNVHQDYIIRQRYVNSLPPPPGAPKLLDLPSQGLMQYTMPLYASRMARNQPLNIEADAMLGMPIDLVGMPGVFEGDESSIQATLVPPAVHPKDRNLLRPLKSLGKPKNEVADISFLRRTQYVAEDRGRLETSSRAPSGNVKRRKADSSKEDPMNILRATIKGFDISNHESTYKGPDTTENIRGLASTNAEVDAWKNPKHPTKPHLKVVDSYPMLPDLDATTDDSGFVVFKFSGNPTDVIDAPDPRMENALLRPIDTTPEVAADFQAKLNAYKTDPVNNKDPGLPPIPYEFFLPADTATALSMKAMLDIDNLNKDNIGLYTHASEGGEKDSFRFNHVRIYDSGHQVDNRSTPYQEVAIALHDPDLTENEAGAEVGTAKAARPQKAAYYYPILSKSQIKPRRTMQLAQLGLAGNAEEEEQKIDFVDVSIRDPDEEEAERRSKSRQEMDIRDGKEKEEVLVET